MPVNLFPIEPPESDPDDPLGLLAQAEEAPMDELAEGVLSRSGKAIASIISSLDWDANLHPRNRRGQFIETPDAPKPISPPSVPEVPRKEIRRPGPLNIVDEPNRLVAADEAGEAYGFLNYTVNGNRIKVENAAMDPAKEDAGWTNEMLRRLREKFPDSEGYEVEAPTLMTKGMASPPAGYDESGPRYPSDADKGQPDGRQKRAGELIRPGQTVTFEGGEWQVSHIAQGYLILDESSGDREKVGTRIIGPEERTPQGTVPGLKVGKPRNVQPASGSKETGEGFKGGSIQMLDPYVDRDSHDPSLTLPEASALSAEQWAEFGRIEQLHYLELMDRYGKWKGKDKTLKAGQEYLTSVAAPVGKLIKQVLDEFDDEIVQMVKSANQNQKYSSTGSTFSLVGYANGDPVPFEKREKAMELQARVRDILAWDLYNRLGSPDIISFHGDQNDKGVSWWKKLFKADGIFSGLSQTYSAKFAKKWASGTVVITPLSIRHLVMATFVSNWFDGGYINEVEISTIGRLKSDDRTFVVRFPEMGPEARQWVEETTSMPQPASALQTLRDHLEKGVKLPVFVPANIQMGNKETPPPPGLATEAMTEYEIPEILDSTYDPTTLAKQSNLPWKVVDDNGNPVSEVAAESGVQIGDFMVGLKGTLYWIGPDPNDDFGLRYHKLVKNSNGSMAFNGESYSFEGGGSKKYFFLKGNVQPTKVKGSPDFDPGSWQFANEDPMSIGDMPVGSKFKVNGKAYEKTDSGDINKTPIMDLETGNLGQINTQYETTRLLPKDGVSDGTSLEPAKGMTLSYEAKKHIITSVKKDGTVSIKPSGGGKVVKLSPDDPALDNLFDPSQWEIGDSTKLANLAIGEIFQGGQGTQTVKPFRVIDIEGKKVQWQNLDTGEKGSSTVNKTVKKLDPLKGSPGDAEPLVPEVAPDLNPPGSTPQPEVPTADAPEVPTVITGAAEPLDLSDVAYGSKWGSGAKYKHDQIKDMSNGTIFQVKGGKQYKVVADGANPIVTDGEKNYSVNGNLRGRALPLADALPFANAPTLNDGDTAPETSTQTFTPTKWGEVQPGDIVTMKPPGGEPFQMTVASVALPDGDGTIMKVTWQDGSVAFRYIGDELTQENGAWVDKWIEPTPTALPTTNGSGQTIDPNAPKSAWVQQEITTLMPGDFAQLVVGNPSKVVSEVSLLQQVMGADDTYEVTFQDGTSIALPASATAITPPIVGDTTPEPPPTPATDALPKPVEEAPVEEAVVLPPVKADDLDALPEAAEFMPYKSKWGSGAKYTHDKINEMPVGTVFKDKNGKFWKVQSNGAQAVISDGATNFQVDGNLRGRAYPGKSMDAPAPPIVEQPYGTGDIPGVEGPEPGAAVDLKANDAQTPLADLPINTVVSMDGETSLLITGEEAAPGVMLLLPSNGGAPTGINSSVIPTHIAEPANPVAGFVTPKGLILKDMVANELSVSELVKKHPEHYFLLSGSDGKDKLVVYNKMKGGFYGVQEDGTLTMPPGFHHYTIPTKVLVPAPDAPPESEPDVEAAPEQTPELIANFGEGDEFEVEIDGTPTAFEVIAVGAANSWVKDKVSGQMLTLDNDDQPTTQTVAQAVKGLEPKPEEVSSYPGGGGVAVAELQALTDDAIKALPEMPIKFYKSKWGSGAKYKHDFLDDLEPGDHFTPSGTTDEYILVKSVGGGTVLIYKPSDGTYGLADGKGRVRKV